MQPSSTQVWAGGPWHLQPGPGTGIQTGSEFPLPQTLTDHGVDLYGNAIIVNTDFATENPEAVKGFLEAVAMGWKDAIADPAGATESLMERNPAADARLEERRLQLAIDANVVTDWTQANGFGGIDDDRMASAIEQMKLTYEFQNEPDAALYFSDAYLPDGGFALE